MKRTPTHRTAADYAPTSGLRGITAEIKAMREREKKNPKPNPWRKFSLK